MAIRTRDSAISKTEYDVFLSFRGPDTRQGFTDVLYNHLIEIGIQAFRDDDELAIGDTIELILEAINNSKICVPIFSKSFASSAWCLREVAKMVELNKEIVPIFYDVTPEDVKLKTSLYVDQLKEHQQTGKAQLEEWKKALLQVGRIKGRELKDTSFVEFNKKFGAEISLKFRVKHKYTIRHLVEMPDKVEEALKLLEIESVGVRFLGLYGMGGVGKTTLAKIIFNRISSSFNSCCFLTNIREDCSSKGVEYLRTKLLQDLNPKAVSNNMNFRMKSVLIVLDDVGERSHIEELLGDSISSVSRSRIIITTRDKRALLANVNAEEASSSGQDRANVSTCLTMLEVKGMTTERAMQLFSKHAFGRDYPLEDYTSLSKDVISICGGLPLALEVIGSLLYGMSVEEWEDKVTSLKKIPAEDVQKKLMISYNALEDNVKEIFLDIACFFIQEEKSNPIHMWRACGYAPTWSIRVLISMSLVKITEDGKFWMHDQLRDLGREVVRIKRNNSPTFREGSRILTYEDTLSVREMNKGNELVGLRLLRRDERLQDFANLGSLRFLQVLGDAAFHHRIFWHLSTNLRWLSLTLDEPNLNSSTGSIFSAVHRDNSYLRKLAVLDLSGSAITDSWEGWILIQELRRLKVLDLSKCNELTRTLNFSKMEALEKLIFYQCSRLAKIDSSIGKLRKLKYLNLEDCNKLEELPEEVGNLEDVEKIIIYHTRVSKLPDSVGKLKNLEHLDLGRSEMLKKLPESIGDLSSLVHLDISGSSILEELPANIGLLTKLKHLNLSCCECLGKLPDSIGDLRSLVSLDLSCCSMIVGLPSSITRLEKLERLFLAGCRELVNLPDELGKLESLVELNFALTGVDTVPESIGDLSRLEVINLTETRISVLPKTIAQLSLLQTLSLFKTRIERFPMLPTSLTHLEINGSSLSQTLDLSNLSQLRVLALDYGGSGFRQVPHIKFDSIGQLLRLEVLDLYFMSQSDLPGGFSALTRLKCLRLSCPKLVCIPPFPSSLQRLSLRNLKGETKSLCLSNLNNLSELEFRMCSYMEERILNNCGLDRLESLIVLEIYWNHSIVKLPDLSRLKRLEQLKLYFCSKLVEIPGLGELVSLKQVVIDHCGSLERLENIQNLTSLRSVNILGCKNFRGIQSLEDLEVSTVEISGCKCKDIIIGRSNSSRVRRVNNMIRFILNREELSRNR